VIHSETEIAEFKSQGIFVLKRGDPDYPKGLLRLAEPPEVLYARGNLELLSRPIVSVVGTRRATPYGLDVAGRFARVFVESGAVVMSGLADGIDTAAHRGAISASSPGGFQTIAVLGNGFNHYFPTSNRDLQNQIAEHGLLLSEYLPNEHGTVFTFPRRNRIVAALAAAVLIVEADTKSGTMITKDYAVDLGVDVFAVAGNITSAQSRGTNGLIRDGSCRIATEPNDVLRGVLGVSRDAVKRQACAPRPNTQVTVDQAKVLDALRYDEIHLDDLVERVGMNPRQILTLLGEMELGGFIEKRAGNMFRVKR
jgi:DNA processing protein